MSLCPKCGKPLAEGARDCPYCGIVPAKWKPRRARSPVRIDPLAGFPPAPPPDPARLELQMILLSGLLLGLLFLGATLLSRGLILLRSGMKTQAPAPPGMVPAQFRHLPGGPFDAEVALPGSPIGLASGPGELLTCDRLDPWGLIRVRGTGTTRPIVQRVPVTEPTYRQKIALTAVTWNGVCYVGCAEAAWFQRGPGRLFTVHHAGSLALISVHPAPDLVGAVAWDGVGYWAATRKNTEGAAEEAWLYRLDSGFSVLERFPSPAAGCQGLAWDGRFLWLADVFTHSLYLLDTSAGFPRVVAHQDLGLEYPSGVAIHSGRAWVAEYGGNTVKRIDPQVQRKVAEGANEAAGAKRGGLPAEALPR